MPDPSDKFPYFSLRIKPLLEQVYSSETAEKLFKDIFDLVEGSFAPSVAENLDKWTEDNVQLITYGDSICSSRGEKPLKTLSHFLETYVVGKTGSRDRS